MTRNAKASLVYAATIATAGLAAALMSTGVYAEGPLVENPRFVSGTTRADVSPSSSGLSTEQVRNAYKMSREEANAMTSEDSGSVYLTRHAQGVKAAATMGAPALGPASIEKSR